MKIIERITINSTSAMKEIRKFLRDILRDSNSTKYSMTKFAALIGLILFSYVVIVALKIMITKNEIDHVLVVEIIGFILTVLGFKNNFGFSKTATGDQQIKITNEGTDVDMNINAAPNPNEASNPNEEDAIQNYGAHEHNHEHSEENQPEQTTDMVVDTRG